MIKVIIIEDEPVTAERLKQMIGRIASDFEVVNTLDSVEDSITWLNEHPQADILFMDIHLADGNSFEIFEKVKVTSPVIFTTAYDQYAIRAFKVNSIDYLLKPIKQDELAAAINKFRENLHRSQSLLPDYATLARILGRQEDTLNRLMIRLGQTIKAIGISEVAYFFVEERINYVMLKNGTRYPVDQTMDHYEKQLDSKRFFRINRSFIISFESIGGMTAYSKSRIKVELKPPCQLESVSSTDRSSAFRDWLSGNG